MDEIDIISSGYKELFGDSEIKVNPLPRSGSDRKYFRILTGEKTVIGAFNPVREENEAFVGFTEHFNKLGLKVPEIYGYLPEKHIYFLQDLGDNNLFTWIKSRPEILHSDKNTLALYRKILDALIIFQTKGSDGLNLDLCYPHKSFDRQSMMWDMNYFKYMFIKLLAVPFNEKSLEHDFISLAEHLLEAGEDYFLYRDFQSANIMVMGEEPWFIDYQGGRKGAPQYDVASLLYDAKITMAQAVRDELLEYYINSFCSVSKTGISRFRQYYAGFSMVRLMQALGAFGFRGLYEKKPTFIESIVPGVNLLLQVTGSTEKQIKLPELYRTIKLISGSKMFQDLTSVK